MIRFLTAFVVFWRDVFSDGGSPSFSRVAAGFALLCTMRWCAYLVNRTQAIPDLLNVLYLVGGLYFINRLPDILAAISAIKQGRPVEPSPKTL